MPVTRHPPCRPGRAVCPHPVPRLYARPRCTALPSREYPPSFDFRDARPGSLSPIKALGTWCPGAALPLPTAPIAPCEPTAPGPLETAVPRAAVAVPTVVGGVAPPPGVPPPGACTPRQMPMWCAPCRHPPAGGLALLACRAACDARHAVTIWPPGPLASPQRDAPPSTGVETTASQAVGLVWRHLQGAFLPPFGPHPIQPFRLVSIAKGADPVIGRAAPEGLAAPVGLDTLCEPPIPGVVHIPSGQDGGAAPALGRAGLWRHDASVGLQHAGLQPLPAQAENGAVSNALAQHGPQPRMVQLVEAAWHLRLHQRARLAVLEVAGAGADRLHRPPSGVRAVTTIEKVLRLDCRPQRRAGQGHPLVFERRTPSGPFRALFRGHVATSDQCGPGALRLQALCQCREVAVSGDGIGRRRPAVSPTGRLLVQLVPAVEPHGGLQPPRQVPQAVALGG